MIGVSKYEEITYCLIWNWTKPTFKHEFKDFIVSLFNLFNALILKSP
jgi:hypothetical protein